MIFSHGLHGFSRIEWSGKIDNLGSECHNVYMSTAVRYTPQKKQELRSRHQLADRLTEFGWVPVVPEDLGEDFIVHIYHEGRATGVNFFVQLKSVTNLNGRRKGDYLPYSFEVKDLLHWEQFTLPVVLIVWDVELREGRWVLLSSGIQELDKAHTEWRRQKTKTINIPWRNTVDFKGIIRLRQEIGRFLYPQISNNQSLEMTVSLNFPPTEEGFEAQRALEKHLKEGEPVTLKGRIIQDIKFSDWFGRWFGEYDPDKVELSLGSKRSSRRLIFDLIMYSNQGNTASLHNIDFKVEKAGSELVQVSNSDQISAVFNISLTLRIRDGKTEGTLSLTANDVDANVKILQDYLVFLQTVSTGGQLQLVAKIDDEQIEQSMEIPVTYQKLIDSSFLQTIEKLCFIQRKTRQTINISNAGLLEKDIEAANELFSILCCGRTEKVKQTFTGEFKGLALEILADLQEKSKPINLTMYVNNSYVELLSNQFPTGPMERYILDAKFGDKSPDLNSLTNLEKDKFLKLELVDATVIEIFPDSFLAESNKLSQILVEKFDVASVYLFGSLAWGERFSPQTDIDLAVTGLNSDQLFKAIGYIEQVTQFPFDLVDLNAVPKTLRQRILQEGKLLYERELVAVGG